MIILGKEEQAFARGGNRICFVHPDNKLRCVKVLRPDRSPAIKQAKAGPLKRFKPKRYFDDNREEIRVYARIENNIGDPAWQLVPRCYGVEDTDWGPGVVTELLSDFDGRVSLTLKQIMWQEDDIVFLNDALNQFIQRWSELGMPSRKLLVHNIVVQRIDAQTYQFKVIDGLGWPDLLPLGNWFPAIAKIKATKKAEQLRETIASFMAVTKPKGEWGYHGWLDEEQRIKNQQE